MIWFALTVYSDDYSVDNKSPQERPKSAKRKSPENPTKDQGKKELQSAPGPNLKKTANENSSLAKLDDLPSLGGPKKPAGVQGKKGGKNDFADFDFGDDYEDSSEKKQKQQATKKQTTKGQKQ